MRTGELWRGCIKSGFHQRYLLPISSPLPCFSPSKRLQQHGDVCAYTSLKFDNVPLHGFLSATSSHGTDPEHARYLFMESCLYASCSLHRSPRSETRSACIMSALRCASPKAAFRLRMICCAVRLPQRPRLKTPPWRTMCFWSAAPPGQEGKGVRAVEWFARC